MFGKTGGGGTACSFAGEVFFHFRLIGYGNRAGQHKNRRTAESLREKAPRGSWFHRAAFGHAQNAPNRGGRTAPETITFCARMDAEPPLILAPVSNGWGHCFLVGR